MTLEEFVNRHKNNQLRLLDEFLKLWQKNHNIDPKSWPMDLSEADWYEQFYNGFVNAS